MSLFLQLRLITNRLTYLKFYLFSPLPSVWFFRLFFYARNLFNTIDLSFSPVLVQEPE